MKTLIFCVPFLVMLVGCQKDVTTTTTTTTTTDAACSALNAIPPFSQLRLQYTINIPSTTPSSWSNFTGCQAGAWTGPSTTLDFTTGRYGYTFVDAGMPHMSQSPTPPDNSVLTVRTSGTIVTFDMTGILRRVGQYAPTDYKSDNGCDKWSSELVNYSYVLKVDPTKKTTVSAVLTLAGKGYKSTYDVTNSMAATFATSQNYSAQNNEWQFFIGDPAKGSMMIQNMDKTHSLDASIFVNIHRIQ